MQKKVITILVIFIFSFIAAFGCDNGDGSQNITDDANPDVADPDKVIQAFELMLEKLNGIDGLFTKIIDGRTGQNLKGIIPWDLSLCTEAAYAMAEISDDFSDESTDSLSELATYIENEFLQVYDDDNNNELDYAEISLTMPLFVLVTYSAGDNNSSLITSLTNRLIAIVTESGAVKRDPDDEHPDQTSAYALLALKKIESDKAQQVQEYLESRINDNGIIWTPNEDDEPTETFEVEGEALRALTYKK